ncbi:MAG: flagellin [Syntrophothermus sp.]
MRINNNIEAINSHRNLQNTSRGLAKAMERLSSGLRVNRAADDAAGLAISEKLRSQVRGLNTAIKNAESGISLIQTAEGALNETHSILQRMRDLAVQAANGIYSTTDRGNLDKEFQQLISEVTRIAGQTEFNGLKLLDGSLCAGFTLQIGANAGQVITVGIVTADSNALAISALALTTIDAASAAISSIDAAINTVSGIRADLGAVQNRMEHTITNLSVASENLAASESRIRDADMAQEMVEFTKLQILQQSGTAMLAQANTAPQAVLSLLR